MRWTPQVTVATLVEHDGRFLLVYEQTDQGMRYNQPAGHLEAGESLTAAAVRETLEETRWEVEASHVLGLSRFVARSNGRTYLRTSFVATPLREHPERDYDAGIECAVWLTYEEVLARRESLRSPMVLADIEAYRRGTRYPLALIRELG